MSIYSEIILDHYNFPRNQGKLQSPTNTVVVSNPLCGDELLMDVLIKNNKVAELKFRGSGCAISLAAASMLTEYSLGKSTDELRKLNAGFIINMLGIELGPNRVRCATLSLEALHNLVSEKK